MGDNTQYTTIGVCVCECREGVGGGECGVGDNTQYTTIGVCVCEYNRCNRDTFRNIQHSKSKCLILCMWACVCVCTRACVYMRVRTHWSVCSRACVCVCAHNTAYMGMCMCVIVCVCMCMYKCPCVCMTQCVHELIISV